MRVIFKAPRENPHAMVIPNELKVMQQLVGGNIETARFSDNVIIVMNEEGKLLGLEPNFFLTGIGLIVGPVLIVGTNGDEFADLPEDKIAKLYRTFMEVEA